MILLACGTRTFLDVTTLEALAKSKGAQAATFLVVGDCRGPDTHIKDWAKGRGVPGVVLQAHWDAEGPSAGPNRNARLVKRTLLERTSRQVPAVCFALWDGQSQGTADTIRKAQGVGLPLEVWLVKGEPPRLARPQEIERLLANCAKRHPKKD